MSIDRDVRTACWRSLLRVSGLALVLLVPAGIALGFVLAFPGLNFSDLESGNQNGVAPNSGASGTEFTFYVSYWDFESEGPPGAAPTMAELHIDLNGDALVAGSVLARPVGIAAAGGAPLPALVLAFSVLAGLVAYLALPRKRLLMANLALFTAAGLWLFACSSGDGSANANHDGLALASCTSPSDEVVEMALVDSASPDYATPPGEDFFVTLTLNCDPGVVLFRFEFVSALDTEIQVGNAIGYHYLIIED